MLLPRRGQPRFPAAGQLRWLARRADKMDEDGSLPRRGYWKVKEELGRPEIGREGAPLHLHKSRGQHILTNPRVLDAIVRKADVRPTDTVLEIGPGTGNLTVRLLKAARRVVAVEIDPRMVDVVHSRVGKGDYGDRLTVVCEDALKTKLPDFELCVSNIPYGISSPLVVKLLYGGFSFRSATLLLQKEFAKRLRAKPGESEYNRLAVNVNLVASVKYVMDVSKKDFVPCPKVDSGVVRIEPKMENLDVDLGEWRAFIRACFSNKNKTLGAIFKQKSRIRDLLKIASNEPTCRNEEDYDDMDAEAVNDVEEVEGDDVAEMFVLKDKLVATMRDAGFEGKRPSKLSIEELQHLLRLFNEAGIYFHHSF